MAVFFQEKPGKLRDVLFPFPERRQRDIDNVQTVIEVLSETACPDQCGEVLVRGRYDARVDSKSLVSTDPPEFSRIEETEEVLLEAEGHLSDLIEKQGPFVSHFHYPVFCLVGVSFLADTRTEAKEEQIPFPEVPRVTKEELKELYKKQMKEGRLSEKGGAGLGFIDIKRKTNKELEYHFLPISDDTSFFLLTSTISRADN